jgi:tetratricopeptide (TPR) repeat protein
MKHLSILILVITILLSLGCLDAKKAKATTPTAPPPEEVIEQKPILQQAQEKAIEAEKLDSEKRYSEAADAFETALGLFQQADKEAAPTDTTKQSIQLSIQKMYKNLSIDEEASGDYAKAVHYLDKRLETDSLNTTLISKKYTILKDNLMDQKGGVLVLENYASRHENYEYDLIIADFYAATNDIPVAISWYKKADLIKKDPKVTYNLGKYNRDLKNYAESNKYFEEYLTMNPKPEELNSVYKILGANYKTLGNNAKAITYFEKAIVIAPDPKISLALFDLYYKAKNDKMTIKYANQVLQADPSNNDVIFVRGMSEYNLKDMVKAKADFEKVAADPKYAKYAKQYLDSMK